MSTAKCCLFAAAAILALNLYVPVSHALTLNGITLEAGRGDGADLYRINVDSTWMRRWFVHRGWSLGDYWEFDVGRWTSAPYDSGADSLTEIGVTPVFRLQSETGWVAWPYLEAGIGAHLLSHTAFANRDLSTAFLFGDLVGAGVVVGPGHCIDLGYRFQHLSNASIKEPNSGINFQTLRLGCRF